MKRQVEIEDNLTEIVDGAKADVKELALEWLNDNPDADEGPDLGTLDDSGRVHETVASAVPIYTATIDGLFYLYGSEFEEAFDNAGIGEKKDGQGGFPCGWKPAAIYCYIEQEVSEWYDAKDIFTEWQESRAEAK